MTDAIEKTIPVKINLAFIFVAMLLVFSGFANAQNEQYAQGLVMDLYVVESPDDAKGPKGRSVATMVDPTPNTIAYLEPIEIEPALEQFRDKPWGLHSQGFLKVEEAGPYSFNLLMTSSDESMVCTSWLKVQDRTITGHELDRYFKGNHNQYGDVTLKPGIYTLEAWLGCSEIQNNSAETTKPNVMINVRGPNDAMLKPIPKNRLLHEL